MNKWYTVSCKHCGLNLNIHVDWSDPPEYHEECAWYEEPCAICGKAMRIHRVWAHPPSVHKKCAWYEESCAICGKAMWIHHGWVHPLRVHKECREAAQWETRKCEICGKSLKVGRDWVQKPTAHSDCRKLLYEKHKNMERGIVDLRGAQLDKKGKTLNEAQPVGGPHYRKDGNYGIDIEVRQNFYDDHGLIKRSLRVEKRFEKIHVRNLIANIAWHKKQEKK